MSSITVGGGAAPGGGGGGRARVKDCATGRATLIRPHL
jgi:hypothetical protein